MYIINSCMDTYNDDRMATGKILENLSGHRVVVGAKQLKKAVHNGCAKQVFLARNADPAIVEPILALCKRYATPVLWVKTMKELGLACGIEVGASAAATVRD